MRLLAALLVLVPRLALSQSPEPQPPSPQPETAAAPAPAVAAPVAPVAPAEPVAPVAVPVASPSAELLWSIGAGLTVDQIVILSGTGTTLVDARPAINASLERRLSRGTWLAVGVVGLASRLRDDGGSVDMTGDYYAQLAVNAGIRRIVTPNGAPVDVSLLALANAGYTATEDDDGGTPDRFTSWGVGAELGLAVERKLMDGLALRVGSPLVGLSWTRQESEGVGPPRNVAYLRASLALAPRIELRLAF